MQESSEHALGEAQEFLASLESDIIKNLCSESRKKRGIAIDKILKKLDSDNNGTEKGLLQELPVALVQSHEYIGSIYFIEKCIRNGKFFDPRIIDTVINAVVIEKFECIKEEDSESAEVITQILHRFYNTILTHPEYQKKSEIYLSIGTNVEQENNIITAINLYNEAIRLGSMDGYFCAACAYESLHDYDMSASIFDAAYQISGEERFLHRYIHALCKAGKREEAYTCYLHLQSKNKNTVDGFQESNKAIVSPFIVYLEEIHSDEDLHEFELLMTSYYIEGTLIPSESLRIIAENASLYIANEIEKESKNIENLNLVPIESWTDLQDDMYWQSIKRRLSLMQNHIITIQDPRYLEFYLEEMQSYTIEGNTKTQHLMLNYFIDSFSKCVDASYCEITGDDSSTTGNMSLIESVRIHLIQIKAIYSQASNYEIIRDTIDPFIEKCLKFEGLLDDSDLIQLPQFQNGFTDQFDNPEIEKIDESVDYLRSDEDDLVSLRKESQDFELLTKHTRKMYEDYMRNIDKKYGIFYRRTLQQLARDEMGIPPSLKSEFEKELIENGGDYHLARNTIVSNMQIFFDYPDITLFFFLEKILLGQDYLDKKQSLEDFIIKYHLENLMLSDALLFAAILHENGESYNASEYIMHVSGMLTIPQALHMIMDSLRYIETENELDIIIKNLDIICQEEYNAKGFFEYFTTLAFEVFESSKIDDEEIGYILMASANMKCIHDGETKEIIAEFEAAGDRGIVDGYISVGDILEEQGDYVGAMEYYNRAHLLSPTIITIRRILNVLLLDSRFDEAWKYINMAIRDEYDVSGYTSAWYLYQGKNKEAMEELCKILQSDGRIDHVFPEGYIDFMLKAIEAELSSPDISIEQSHLTVLASYINASFVRNEEGLNISNYIIHIEYIEWLVNAYNLTSVSRVLLETIPILTGNINLDNDMSSIDQSSGYLHFHLVRIHTKLVIYHKNNCDNLDIEATKKTFNLINSLSITAMQILKKFPDSEKYCIIWEDAMNLLPTIHDRNKTIHRMPEIIQ